MAVQIQVDDALAGVLDARREGLGDLEQRLLGGALARAVAPAGDQLGDERARLGQRHSRLDPGFARLA